MVRGLVGAALCLLVARDARALLTLQVAVDAEVRGDTSVRVTVNNVGDEPAHHLTPDVTFVGTTAHGKPVEALPPRFTEGWELALPHPPGPGTFPLVVDLHYADAFGHRLSAPVVHVVRTPGMAPPQIRIAVEADAITTTGRGRVTLDNPENVALDARLAVVAGAGVGVDPSSRPVVVPAHGQLDVPLRFDNPDAPPGGTVPIYAWVTIARDDRHETAVASANVAVVDAADRDGPGIGALGLAAILAAGAALAVLWRRRRSAPRTRAERRRDAS